MTSFLEIMKGFEGLQDKSDHGRKRKYHMSDESRKRVKFDINEENPILLSDLPDIPLRDHSQEPFS